MTNKNNKKIKMPQWYLSKQVSINWSSKPDTPDKRPIGESFKGFFAEIFFGIIVFSALVLFVLLIWVVSLI